jgi:sarcosine oxidase
MAETWDCIVLGVGAMGSGALRSLARRGARVLGLEQHGVAHDLGSSHGETRIIRKAYFEHPDYVPLLHRAFEGWRDLEASAGRSLFTAAGLFLAGAAEGETVGGTIRAAQQHRLPLDRLSPAEARRAFPGFEFAGEDTIVFEREAGYLRVEACVRAQVDDALAHGATLRTGEFVTGWSSDGRTVRVLTDRGIHEGATLIVTAGAWASRLLRDLNVPLRVLRKVQLWFGVAGKEIARPDRDSPCFLYERPEGAFYGFPSLDGATIKVAEHTGGEEVEDPALVDRRLHEADVAPVRRFVASSLPAATGDVLRHSVCLYTMSPDGHFAVDRHPHHGNVAFGAGFSGHGFKFAGVIGEALADLALNGRTTLPIQFLGLDRFRPR